MEPTYEIQITHGAYFSRSDILDNAWHHFGYANTVTGMLRHYERARSKVTHGNAWSGNIRVLGNGVEMEPGAVRWLMPIR